MRLIFLFIYRFEGDISVGSNLVSAIALTIYYNSNVFKKAGVCRKMNRRTYMKILMSVSETKEVCRISGDR